FDLPFLDDLTVFNNALWFTGLTPNQGAQLYKLRNDGSVTKWTTLSTAGFGLAPTRLDDFNDALWFNGVTPAGDVQLYELGIDRSLTQWPAIPDPMSFGPAPRRYWYFYKFPERIVVRRCRARSRPSAVQVRK